MRNKKQLNLCFAREVKDFQIVQNYLIFQDNYIRETQIQQRVTKMSRQMVNQNFLKTQDSQMRTTTNLPPSSSELYKVIKSLEKMYQEQKEKREEIEKKIAMVQKRTLQRQTELIRIVKKLKQDNNTIVQQAPEISKLFNKIWSCFDDFNQNTAQMIQKKYEDNYKSMDRRVNVILQHFQQELAKRQQNSCHNLDTIQKQLRMLCETAIKIEDRNTQLLEKLKKLQFQTKILTQEKFLILQNLNLKKSKVNSLTQQIRMLKKLSQLQSPVEDKKINTKCARIAQNQPTIEKPQQIKRSQSKGVEHKQTKQLLKQRSQLQPSALSTLDFYYKEIKGSKNEKEMTKIGSTISYTPTSSHNRSYTSQTHRNVKNNSLFVTNNKVNKNKDLESYKISLRVSSVNNYDEDNNCINLSIKKANMDKKENKIECHHCKKYISLPEPNLKQDKLKEQQYISTIASLQKCLKRQKQRSINLGNTVTRISNKSQQVNEALQKIIMDIQVESTTSDLNGASKKLDSILQSQKFFNMIKVLQQRLSMLQKPSVNCGWGDIWSETMPEM